MQGEEEAEGEEVAEGTHKAAEGAEAGPEQARPKTQQLGRVRKSRGRASFRGFRGPGQGGFVAKRRFPPGIRIRWHVSPNF